MRNLCKSIRKSKWGRKLQQIECDNTCRASPAPTSVVRHQTLKFHSTSEASGGYLGSNL